MMASAWMLTGDARVAIIMGFVPFVLGVVYIQTHLAYMLTAAVFLVSVVFQIVGQDLILDGKAAFADFLENAKIVRGPAPGKTAADTGSRLSAAAAKQN
jgi:hypothetical protein